KTMLVATQGKATCPPADVVASLCQGLRRFIGTDMAVSGSGANVFEISLGPLDDRFTNVSVDGVIADLGVCGLVEEIAAPGILSGNDPDTGSPIHRRCFRLVTDISASDLADVLGITVDPERMQLRQVDGPDSDPQAKVA